MAGLCIGVIKCSCHEHINEKLYEIQIGISVSLYPISSLCSTIFTYRSSALAVNLSWEYGIIVFVWHIIEGNRNLHCSHQLNWIVSSCGKSSMRALENLTVRLLLCALHGLPATWTAWNARCSLSSECLASKGRVKNPSAFVINVCISHVSNHIRQKLGADFHF